MKANLEIKGQQFVLGLTPENDNDRNLLAKFGTTTVRIHSLICRGFEYMKDTVEFLVQPYSDSK